MFQFLGQCGDYGLRFRQGSEFEISRSGLLAQLLLAMPHVSESE